MRFKPFNLSFLMMSLLGSYGSAWADLSFIHSSTIDSSFSNNTAESNTNPTVSLDQVKNEAQRWGLTAEDYSRYLDLMKKTPSSQWYPHADPMEVLAINARDDKERQRFTEIIVKTTHDRLEKELAMQRAFTGAWKKLYPDLKPIEMPSLSKLHSTLLQPGDQLLLFMNPHDENGSMIQSLISVVEKNQGVKLAIFAVGKDITDQDIQKWAKDSEIPASLVQQGVIILDHDRGHFSHLAKDNAHLPMIVLNHKGVFKTIELSEIKN